jgi:pimeloyl-ACP methyl ester carboxylesterase
VSAEQRSLVFLPGAGGACEFWLPVATRLPDGWQKALLNWPGAGNEPSDLEIAGYGDLTNRLRRSLHGPTDLIAQSMGGIVALALALQAPQRIRRLVLVATSGGVDVGQLGATDWRNDYRTEYPNAARWIIEERVDYTDSLPTIQAKTLLIWGDADPISPVAVGRRLAQLLPNSDLHVLPAATHSLAHDRPDEVACLIEDHLR